MNEKKCRKELLEIAKKYQPLYRLFVWENPDKVYVGHPDWRNHIEYMEFVVEINKQFKEENGIDQNDPIIWYFNERSAWVDEKLKQYECNGEKVRLINERLTDWVATRDEVENELSEKQSMFCACDKLATGLHGKYCRKFQSKVDKETVKRL